MFIDIIVGGQYGDEGKGAICAKILNSYPERYGIIAKAFGGSNAGHTIFKDNKKYIFRMLPCGSFHKTAKLVIGAGVLINPDILLEEIQKYNIDESRIFVDYRATIVEQKHIDAEKNNNNLNKIGSTCSGTGAALLGRVARVAKLAKDEPRLKKFITDVPLLLNKSNENILIEGSHGFELSNLYGLDYPNVTSCDTTAANACVGLGLNPRLINKIILCIKPFTTRVGGGKLLNEINEEEVQKRGLVERGSVTNRLRRVSLSLDIDRIKYAALINGATEIAISKLDSVIDEFDKINEMHWTSYLQDLDNKIGLPITIVGNGPEVTDVIFFNFLEKK